MHSANGYVEKTIHLSSPSASSGFGTFVESGIMAMESCGEGLDRAFQVLLYAIRDGQSFGKELPTKGFGGGFDMEAVLFSFQIPHCEFSLWLCLRT